MKEITIKQAAEIACKIQEEVFGAAEGNTHLTSDSIVLYSHNESTRIDILFEVLNEGADKIIKKLNSMKPYDNIGCLMLETKNDLD